MTGRVRVHWNLHRGGYSVTVGGRVVATPASICLRDCVFVVSDASLARMRRLGRRKVVAWIEGVVCDDCADHATGDRVTFNPWRADRFHVAGDPTRVVETAAHVRMDSGVDATGKPVPVATVVA
jgi:hypothetical protein